MTKIPDYLHKLNDAEKLKIVMQNAKSKSEDEIYWFAFKRYCDLSGINHSDPMEEDFYKVLAAYEQLLTEKNGKNTKANRTRQKLKRHSVHKCLEDWALSKTPTEGFELLIKKGQRELTAEALVIKYMDRFEPNVVAAARKRLDQAA